MERDDDHPHYHHHHLFHPYRSKKIPANSSASALKSGGATSSTSVIDSTDGGVPPKQLPMEQYMPIANLTRVMRRVLPPHAKISDDAKETVQECVSEFISFITSEANDRCHHELRKTITAEDVIAAMGKLGFNDYIDPLTLFLHRYRESENERDRMPVRRGRDYGSVAANYGSPPPPPPPWTLQIGSQQGLFEAPPTVTRDYFKEGSGAGGGGSPSRLPPEYK